MSMNSDRTEHAFERTTGIAVVLMALIDLLVEEKIISSEKVNERIGGYLRLMEEQGATENEKQMVRAIIEKHLGGGKK